ARQDRAAERRRHRRRDDQHLPLRHLPAHPRRRAPRGRDPFGQGVRSKAMSKPHASHPIDAAELSRREFVVSTAAVAGGFALRWAAPFDAAAQTAGSELNVWVVVQPDDTCVIRIARSEMGQGTLTGLAQLVAEELECDWAKVRTEQISPQANFAAKRA